MKLTKSGFYHDLTHARKPDTTQKRPHRKGTGAKDARTSRYLDPWDNLLYAILLQAAIDSKGDKWGVHCQGSAMKFLQSDTARDWWDYLKTRPTY